MRVPGLRVCVCVWVLQEGNSPLHVAGRCGWPEVTAELLKAGADHKAMNAVSALPH